jgi:hypothetical protein
VTIWTVADLTDLRGRQGWHVHPATVYRALQAMDDRFRRPRHDLTHRQDAEAVASAKHVLTELPKKGALGGAGFRLVDVDACDLHPRRTITWW